MIGPGKVLNTFVTVACCSLIIEGARLMDGPP